MTVVSLEAMRHARERTQHRDVLRQLHEETERNLDRWHHIFQRAPVVRDVLYGWHRFDINETPVDDEDMNGFLLTLTPALHLLEADVIVDICRQHYIDDDTRCWFIIEGLTQLMAWCYQYPGYPMQADNTTHRTFIQTHGDDLVAFVIEQLGAYYQEFLPNFSVARCLRIRQHPTVGSIT